MGQRVWLAEPLREVAPTKQRLPPPGEYKGLVNNLTAVIYNPPA